MDYAKVVEWINTTSGYGIMKPEFFVGMGIPEDVVKRYTYDHSGGEGKYEVQGNPVGVSEFEIIHWVADEVGAEICVQYFGRGKNFRETVNNINRAIRKAAE